MTLKPGAQTTEQHLQAGQPTNPLPTSPKYDLVHRKGAETHASNHQVPDDQHELVLPELVAKARRYPQ